MITFDNVLFLKVPLLLLIYTVDVPLLRNGEV